MTLFPSSLLAPRSSLPRRFTVAVVDGVEGADGGLGDAAAAASLRRRRTPRNLFYGRC